MKQGCFCARDPVREASDVARALVVGPGTHVISNTISQGGDWKFVAWFVMVLVSLHPLHCHLKWKFVDDLKDTLKDVIVSLEEVKDRGIHIKGEEKGIIMVGRAPIECSVGWVLKRLGYCSMWEVDPS